MEEVDLIYMRHFNL